MPRLFFNVQDGSDLPDNEGTVHASPEAARLAAVLASGEMIRAHAQRFWADGNWRMHVIDEQGATVCHLRFSGMAGAKATDRVVLADFAARPRLPAEILSPCAQAALAVGRWR